MVQFRKTDFDTTLASVSKAKKSASFHVFICPLKRHLHILLRAIYNVLPLCVLSEQSEDVSREKLHQMHQPSLRLQILREKTGTESLS